MKYECAYGLLDMVCLRINFSAFA